MCACVCVCREIISDPTWISLRSTVWRQRLKVTLLLLLFLLLLFLLLFHIFIYFTPSYSSYYFSFFFYFFFYFSLSYFHCPLHLFFLLLFSPKVNSPWWWWWCKGEEGWGVSATVPTSVPLHHECHHKNYTRDTNSAFPSPSLLTPLSSLRYNIHPKNKSPYSPFPLICHTCTTCSPSPPFPFSITSLLPTNFPSLQKVMKIHPSFPLSLNITHVTLSPHIYIRPVSFLFPSTQRVGIHSLTLLDYIENPLLFNDKYVANLSLSLSLRLF